MEKKGKTKKAYFIKGSHFYEGSYKEWIESITLSKEKARNTAKKLNLDLIEKIEKGGDIASRNLKYNPITVEWSERKYIEENISEEDYYYFHLYTERNPMPFKVFEVELD